MAKEIVIGKLEAARRQLETAVTLYFNDKDAVSIHTLTAAAHNVLADLRAKQGKGAAETMRALLEAHVKEESKKFLMDRFHEAENFFKHADRDSDKQLLFNTEQTELMLWDALVYYRTLTGEAHPIFLTFNSWFMINHVDLFTLPPQDKEPYLDIARAMRELPKPKFLAEVLAALHHM